MPGPGIYEHESSYYLHPLLLITSITTNNAPGSPLDHSFRCRRMRCLPRAPHSSARETPTRPVYINTRTVTKNKKD